VRKINNTQERIVYVHLQMIIPVRAKREIKM